MAFCCIFFALAKTAGTCARNHCHKANIYAHSGGQVFYKLPVISDLSSIQVLDMLNLNRGNKDIKDTLVFCRLLCAMHS